MMRNKKIDRAEWTMMDKHIIALTGGVGSGKSRILELLKQEYRAEIIQTDLVAKNLERPGKPGYDAIVKVFGKEIVNEDGELKKEALAELIFRDKATRDKINSLIHPFVWKSVQQWTEEQNSPTLVVESAILPENPGDIFHEIWYVYTLRENRIQRLMENRGYSKQKCYQIMESQPSDEEYRKSADYIIDNNGSIEQVLQQLRAIFRLHIQR